jgi:hypothetical protein
MSLVLRRVDVIEQSLRVDDAAGSRDGDDDSHRSKSSKFDVQSSRFKVEATCSNLEKGELRT